MRKFIKRSLSALTGVAMIFCLSALQVSADSAKGDPYPLDGLVPEESSIKPTISLSQIELTLDEAKDNPIQTITLTVDGANWKYAPTGFHIQYDKRLAIQMKSDEENPKEIWFADLGPAGERLSSEQGFASGNCFRIATAAAENMGRDGVLWSFDLKIPDDAKVGDIYPIEIVYKDDDHFTNRQQNTEGLLMQAWVFTNGIEHGYIKITDGASAPPTDVPAAKTGDPTGDGIIDAVDASNILALYANISTSDKTPTEFEWSTCDVNGDGLIDAVDASLVLAYYAHTSTGGTLSFEEFMADDN